LSQKDAPPVDPAYDVGLRCTKPDSAKSKARDPRGRPRITSLQDSNEYMFFPQLFGFFEVLSSDRWDIGIVAEYIFRIIVRFQFAQATIVFWTVCRAHALSLVSRKEIGVRAAGGIGGKRIAQLLGPRQPERHSPIHAPNAPG